MMPRLPSPVRRAEVTEVTEVSGDDEGYIALIRYVGDDGETTVESRWSERDGRPSIVGLRVV
ncbi:MAG: hypothetical protein ABR529_11370 [Actinomycetota bacterium]